MKHKTMRDSLLDILHQPTLDEPTGELVSGSEALRRALKRKADSGNAEAREMYDSIIRNGSESHMKPPEAI